MDQITKEFIIKFLEEYKIELKSTHARLCLPIINRLYKKMSIGIKFSSIKVADDLIIDGHHRYLAAHLAKFKIEKVESAKSSVIDITDRKSIDYVDEEWDTPAKIKMLNELDAKFNDVTLDKIIELLK